MAEPVEYRDSDGTPITEGAEVVATVGGWCEAGVVVDFRAVGPVPEVAVQFAHGWPFWIPANEVGVVPF